MADSQWKQDKQESGTVSTASFDPAALGFEKCIPRRWFYSDGSFEKDYLLVTKNKNDIPALKLSMCDDTSEFVKEITGGTADVYVNDKGQMLVCAGNSYKVSRNGKGGRCNITATPIMEKIFSIHGEFYKLILSPRVYAHGNAVLFTSTGEKIQKGAE